MSGLRVEVWFRGEDMGRWKNAKSTALYLECLKKGHRVVVRSASGFGYIHLECLDCGKMWRVLFYKLQYMESEEVPDVFGGEEEYV